MLVLVKLSGRGIVMCPGGGKGRKREPTFVNEDKAEVVARGVFLVDLPEGGREVEAAEEEADGYCFSCGEGVSLGECYRMWV